MVNIVKLETALNPNNPIPLTYHHTEICSLATCSKFFPACINSHFNTVSLIPKIVEKTFYISLSCLRFTDINFCR